MVRTLRLGVSALAVSLIAAKSLLGIEVGVGFMLDEPSCEAPVACGDVPCCDGCLGPGSGCDCDQCRRAGQWVGGVEATFLRVDASTGGGITLSLDDATTAGTDFAAVGGRGVEDFGTAPRLWIGRKFGENWGIVGRYWRLDEHDTNFPERTPNSANLPNFATFEDAGEVEMQTADLEGTRSFELGAWKFDGSIGGRYASYDTEARMMAFGVFTTGNFVNLRLETGSSFTGAGLTSGLVGRRRLGNTPIFLFASGRGSVMGGETQSFARSVGTVASSPSAPLVGAATVTRTEDESTLTVAEVQVGMEYDFKLAYLPGNAFIRTAFEYQHWNVGGPPVGGAGFGGTIGDLTTNSFASADNGDAILYGIGVSAGYTW